MTSVAKTTLAPDVSALVQGATADASDVTTPIQNLRDYARAGRVAVSDNDTHVKMLTDALVAGTGITLTENNNGANETLTIAASGSITVAGDSGSNQNLALGDTLTVTGGTAIATAMTADTVTVNLDVNELTSSASVNGATDYVVVRKADATHKKVLLNDLPAAAGAMNSFNVFDGTTSESVGNAQNVTFADGTGVDMTVAATRTVTPSLNITSMTEDTAPASTSVLALWNGTNYRKSQLANLGVGNKYAIIRDQRASGTSGGTSTTTTWNARTLQTEHYDSGNLVTISANQFVPIAGTYVLTAWAQVRQASITSSFFRLRLYNVTAVVLVAYGTNVNIGNTSAGAYAEYAPLQCVFTANGTDSYRFDSYSSVGLATTGLGWPQTVASVDEVFLEATLVKIG